MEFKHDINKKLEHKSIRERDENETLYEGIVLVKKRNPKTTVYYNSNEMKQKWKDPMEIFKTIKSKFY